MRTERMTCAYLLSYVTYPSMITSASFPTEESAEITRQGHLPTLSDARDTS